LLRVVKCLVKELGMDVNHGDEEGGRTPLFLAVHEGHLAVVRCLVMELGADVNQASQDGLTLLFMAVDSGNLAMVQSLVVELGADQTSTTLTRMVSPLIVAVQEGHLALMRYLVKELGANANHATHTCCTPLMIASASKHSHIVNWSVKHGADVQASSPLHGMATDVSNRLGASTEQITYLKARTLCANPGRGGAGLTMSGVLR
jgi:ankyrin repeat protein